MALIDGATIDKKFSEFSILQSNYKTVNGHGIRADFLIPKSLTASSSSNVGSGKKVPVIVELHGGCLILGDSLFAPWFNLWVLELAKKHNAIIVSPNHRLLPESTGVDILADVDDFWAWLHTDNELVQTLRSIPIELDLDRVLTTGQSAGGLLSVYLALTFPDEIRSATASYPMFNQDEAVVPAPERRQQKTEAEIKAGVVLQEAVDDIKLASIISSGTLEDRAHIASAAMANTDGLISIYERDAHLSPLHRERLYQLRRLETEPDIRLPKGGLAVVMGREDDWVPFYTVERFVEAAREKLKGRQGGDRIVFSVREGKGHGFDNETSLEEGWLQDALRTAVDVWLE